jgi:hypothetical protein
MRIQNLLAIAALAAAPMLVAAGIASAIPVATFVISPNPVTAGNTVTFSGTGCAALPGDAGGQGPVVYLTVTGEPGTSPAVVPATDGTWSLKIDLPVDFPANTYVFNAVCDRYTESFNYASQSLVVKAGRATGASMFLPAFDGVFNSTPALHAAQGYKIKALGFDPGEQVTLTLHSTPVELATYTAGSDGSVDATFTVPANTVGGAHTLEMTGLSSGLTASEDITVIPLAAGVTLTATTIPPTPGVSSTVVTPTTTAPVTTSSASPVLASTGTPATGLTAFGVALTLGGVATLLVARRRRGSRLH